MSESSTPTQDAPVEHISSSPIIRYDTDQNSQPSNLIVPSRSGRDSSVSRVSIDFFDPAGVEDIFQVQTKSEHDYQRVLTQSSLPNLPYLQEKKNPAPMTSCPLDLTEMKMDNGLDLGNTLRQVVTR